MLKKLHELRPGLQTFFSKNGSRELGQAKTHRMPANRRDSPPPITLQYPSLYAMALPPRSGQERNLQVCAQGLCQVGTQKTSQRDTSSTVGVQSGEGDLTHAEFHFCSSDSALADHHSPRSRTFVFNTA